MFEKLTLAGTITFLLYLLLQLNGGSSSSVLVEEHPSNTPGSVLSTLIAKKL